MEKLLFIFLVVGLSFTGRSQCQADFTNSVTNGTVDFTNTSIGSGLNYYWDFGDGAWSTLVNPTHSYTAIGGYTVCLSIYSNDSLCQDVYCDSLEILVVDDTSGNGCQTAFTYTSNSQGIFCTNTSTSASNFMYSYWDVYDATNAIVSSGGTTNFNYFPTTAGVYNVCLSTYDSLQNLCGTVCELIYFSPDSLDSNLGLFIDDFIFNVYPNPMQEQISIETNTTQPHHAVIVDLFGRKMTEVTAINQHVELDVSNLIEGIYLLMVFNDNLDVIFTRKLRKE